MRPMPVVNDSNLPIPRTFMKRVRNPHLLSQAFTLIEMLVVVTIIVLLLAFSTPALMRTLEATRLSSVGDSLLGAISEAQQISYAQNVPTELRFFSYGGDFGSKPQIRSYQLFKVTLTSQGTGAALSYKETLVPVNSLVILAEGIVIPTDDELSPALSGEGLPDQKDDGSAGYSGVKEATYTALRFMTDGTCRKAGKAQGGFAQLVLQTLPTCFFTITYDNGQEIEVSNLPKNFFTIQVDPYTGKARSYKPGF